MAERLDLHVYTNNSACGMDKVSFLCETAVEKGIRAVAFTDVCGLDTLEQLDTRRRMRHAYYDTAKARQLFFGSLSVFSGIAFEQAYLHPEEASAMLRKRTYDIVLSAVTRSPEGELLRLSGSPRPEALSAFSRRYAELLLQTVRETDFDVLTGLLAPMRGISADLTVFEECMKEVLSALAKKEKALELTTPDILGSERLRDLYMRLISFFLAEGGRYVTIGSESVCFEQVGAGLDIAAAALKRLGLKKQCFYDKRIPYEVEL